MLFRERVSEQQEFVILSIVTYYAWILLRPHDEILCVIVSFFFDKYAT
jgi:hypothetical protein